MKYYQDKELLKELYEAHKSYDKVAEILGCNYKTVARWMKKFDIANVGTQGARKRNLNHDYFEEINTEEKAYWLGFLYADGCVYRGSGSYSYRLQINLQARDRIILEKFQSAIESNYKIQEKKVNNADCVLLKVNSTKMCEDLMNLGVVPRKSLICTFPKLRSDLIPHFIRGYFDGDGCITRTESRGKWGINICGNQAFLTSMQNIFKENDILVNIYDNNHSVAKTLETGSHVMISKLYDFLYKNATVYLERKYEKFQAFMSEQANVPLQSNLFDITG